MYFPQEVVYGIGEIKSKLSKNDLIKALIKLAKIKGLPYKAVDDHASIATPFFKGIIGEITPLNYFLISKTTEVENLKEFLVLLNNFIQDLKSYYPEPTHYLYNE